MSEQIAVGLLSFLGIVVTLITAFVNKHKIVTNRHEYHHFSHTSDQSAQDNARPPKTFANRLLRFIILIFCAVVSLFLFGIYFDAFDNNGPFGWFDFVMLCPFLYCLMMAVYQMVAMFFIATAWFIR